MTGSTAAGAGMAQQGGIAGTTKPQDNTADPAPMAGKGKSADMRNSAKANKKAKKAKKSTTDDSSAMGSGMSPAPAGTTQ
jgi:hypothetical protein